MSDEGRIPAAVQRPPLTGDEPTPHGPGRAVESIATPSAEQLERELPLSRSRQTLEAVAHYLRKIVDADVPGLLHRETRLLELLDANDAKLGEARALATRQREQAEGQAIVIQGLHVEVNRANEARRSAQLERSDRRRRAATLWFALGFAVGVAALGLSRAAFGGAL